MSEEVKTTPHAPKVSVIVPVYKAEKYLRKCVDSILAQTFKDFEVLLVDDGSPDKSGEICDEYAAKYDCIRVKHISNGGAAVARNRGIDMAKGEFIMFVDSDDTIESDMLAELVSLQNRHKVDIAARRLRMKPEYEHQPAEVRYSGIDCIRLLLLRELDSSPCTKLIRRDAIGSIRFPEGVTNEDVVFLYHLYGQVRDVCYLNKSFYYYRENPESVTHSFDKHALDMVMNADRLYNDVRKNYPDLLPVAKSFQITIYLDFCFLVLKRRVLISYGTTYRRCRQECVHNSFHIFKSVLYSWKYKCKLLLILFV